MNCDKKRYFGTFQLCLTVANYESRSGIVRGTDRLFVYKCREEGCGGYHLTKRTPRNLTRKKKPAKVDA